MKIRPVGTELFHADAQTDRRTDMTKLVVPFSEFCERTKKKIWMEQCIHRAYFVLCTEENNKSALQLSSVRYVNVTVIQ